MHRLPLLILNLAATVQKGKLKLCTFWLSTQCMYLDVVLSVPNTDKIHVYPAAWNLGQSAAQNDVHSEGSVRHKCTLPKCSL